MKNSCLHLPRVVLITGGTGFIGSNLVRKLSNEGWLVHVITRQNHVSDSALLDGHSVFYHQFDGTTSRLIQIVQDTKPEVVIHLASLFLSKHESEDINSLVESNLLFSIQLCEAMEKNGVKKLLNTGTSWQFYENIEGNPVNLYAATKEAFEKIINYYVSAHSFNAITLYLFDTYGPNDTRPKLVNLLLNAAYCKRKMDMSPGDQKIVLVYITDVLAGYSIALEKLFVENANFAKHEKFGISTGQPKTLKELVASIEQIIKMPLAINWGERQYRSREVMIPWDGYKQLPGWQQTVTLQTGIALTWESIRVHLNGA